MIRCSLTWDSRTSHNENSQLARGKPKEGQKCWLGRTKAGGHSMRSENIMCSWKFTLNYLSPRISEGTTRCSSWWLISSNPGLPTSVGPTTRSLRADISESPRLLRRWNAASVSWSTSRSWRSVGSWQLKQPRSKMTKLTWDLKRKRERVTGTIILWKKRTRNVGMRASIR